MKRYSPVPSALSAGIGVLAIAITFSGPALAHTKPVPGGQIVFNRFFGSTHHSAALFTVKTSGRAIRELTSPPNDVVDEEPTWSPNGKRVAFQRTESGTTAVYLIGANGRGEHRLLPSGA